MIQNDSKKMNKPSVDIHTLNVVIFYLHIV